MSWTVHHDDRRISTYLGGTRPRGQSRGDVAAHQNEQLIIRPLLGVLGHRVSRVRGASPADLQVVYLDPIHPVCRGPNHGQTHLGGRHHLASSRLLPRVVSHNEHHGIQLQSTQSGAGRRQVPVVRWIEGSSEQSDPTRSGRSPVRGSGAGHGPMLPGCWKGDGRARTATVAPHIPPDLQIRQLRSRRTFFVQTTYDGGHEIMALLRALCVVDFTSDEIAGNAHYPS